MLRNAAPVHRLYAIAITAFALTRAYGQMTSMETTPVGGPGQLMTIEVWSDVVCPFCYIGKRELENALSRFAHRDSVRVVWKSFELDADAPARREVDTYGMLSEKYGMSREQAVERTRGVRERAASLGLRYDFDKAVVGSSFDAHRLIQLAKTKGRGDEMEERLFKAYFTEGKHIADHPTLLSLGLEIGLDRKEVEAMLTSGAQTDAVRADEREAQELSITGVPFFAFDRRFAVSGAQQVDTFLQALERAWSAAGR